MNKNSIEFLRRYPYKDYVKEEDFIKRAIDYAIIESQAHYDPEFEKALDIWQDKAADYVVGLINKYDILYDIAEFILHNKEAKKLYKKG